MAPSGTFRSSTVSDVRVSGRSERARPAVRLAGRGCSQGVLLVAVRAWGQCLVSNRSAVRVAGSGIGTTAGSLRCSGHGDRSVSLAQLARARRRSRTLAVASARPGRCGRARQAARQHGGGDTVSAVRVRRGATQEAVEEDREPSASAPRHLSNAVDAAARRAPAISSVYALVCEDGRSVFKTSATWLSGWREAVSAQARAVAAANGDWIAAVDDVLRQGQSSRLQQGGKKTSRRRLTQRGLPKKCAIARLPRCCRPRISARSSARRVTPRRTLTLSGLPARRLLALVRATLRTVLKSGAGRGTADVPGGRLAMISWRCPRVTPPACYRDRWTTDGWRPLTLGLRRGRT